jgi:hypothetical protein
MGPAVLLLRFLLALASVTFFFVAGQVAFGQAERLLVERELRRWRIDALRARRRRAFALKRERLVRRLVDRRDAASNRRV